MVQIIRDGEPNWQFCVLNVCGDCGCQYRAERGDSLRMAPDSKLKILTLTTDCPTCGNEVETDHPNLYVIRQS